MYTVEQAPRELNFGRQGESNILSYQFDFSQWAEDWPGGLASMTVIPPNQTQPQPIPDTQAVVDGTIITLHVLDNLTEKDGRGTLIIRYVAGTNKKRSRLIEFVVEKGHETQVGSGLAVVEDWVDEAVETLNDVKSLTFTINGNGELLAGETVLGRVSDNPRGDYNPSADPLYSKRDIVFDNGGSYRYINDTPSNEPTSSTSHWQQIASRGMTGPSSAYDAAVAAGYTGTEEEFLAGLVATDGLASRLAQTDLKTLGIPLAKMSRVEVTENYTDVFPIAFHDGWLYGFQNNTTIVRSNNDGETWSTFATSPANSPHSMYWTDDGEVLLGFNHSVLKSIGWSVNPQTATFETVVTRSKGIGILPWGIDGDGTKFIVTEYSAADRSESRYVWISTDMGETFNVVLDKYDIDPSNGSHMHGVCYDKWADRFFVSHGHGDIEGVYWSDDDGATWNLVEADFELAASPTTLTATDNGIVAGSDSPRAGLYGIQRTENPHDMVMRRTARWQSTREGVLGFAYRGVRDEKTGQVYVSFKSDFNDLSPIIMAGTATTGALIWQDTVGSGAAFLYLTVTDNKVIGIHGAPGPYKLIVGDKPTSGVNVFDSGNIHNGKANSSSIAIGQNVDVTTAHEIVIGNNAKLNPATTKTYNVVIGTNAQGSVRDVVIGAGATSSGALATDGVVIGNGANSSSVGCIALGLRATVPVSSTYGIAIGKDATASINSIAIGPGAKVTTSANLSIAIGNGSESGNNSVSIGAGAKAGTSQVAIGYNATSGHGNSIALGSNSATTGVSQLALGNRHIELGVAAEPGVPPVGNARVYLKDNSETGKQELCVRFRNAEVVIATQP